MTRRKSSPPKGANGLACDPTKPLVDSDPIEHPAHYTAHASGIECIAITEHFNFCVGNAIKYLWRAGLKGDALEDLRKGRWYIDREIARLEAER